MSHSVGRSRLMRRDHHPLIQVCLVALSLLVIGAVAFLPWRDIGLPNPFVSGTHLYQMGVPFQMAGLVVLALLALLMGLSIDHGDWPARIVTASGIGIVVLVLIVQLNPATSVLIVSSLHIHLGNAVAIVAGALIAFIGTLCMFLQIRSSDRGTLART